MERKIYVTDDYGLSTLSPHRRMRRLAGKIARRTEDQPGTVFYRDWLSVAHALLRAGFGAIETEAIMRSDWPMRAGANLHLHYYCYPDSDAAPEPGRHNLPARVLRDYAVEAMDDVHALIFRAEGNGCAPEWARYWQSSSGRRWTR